MSDSLARNQISIVIPAKNEAAAIGELLRKIRERHPDAEVVVVDDGSNDGTGELAEACGAKVVRHPYGIGNGAAIKSGAREARGDVLVFMDADGQHSPEDIDRLLMHLDTGYDMVVGARDGESQASVGRWFANTLYNRFATWVTDQRVMDLTSGFRAARAKRFREFLYLLPNGFSYPTTSTMAFMRMGYPVGYMPIKAHKRIGKSHIKPFSDGIRFLLIVFRIGTLYSPLKIFLPVSLALFAGGLGYYLHTYFTAGRFTNMGMLLFVSSIVVFLIGLISEQITMLLYQK